MKQILLAAGLFTLFFSVHAQEEAQVKFSRSQAQNKDVYGGWYNFGSMIYDNLGGVDYFRNHLFPDSSVQVEFSNGFGHVWKHSMGQVFDPADDNWAIGGVVPIDLTDSYTVDSIRVWYRYFRHQTQYPDTIRIQVFTEPNMNLYEDPWSNGQSYATTSYDYTTHSGPNATQVINVLIDDDDTSTVSQTTLDVEINQFVNANEIMGVVVDYLPGNPHNFADTIDQYLSPPPTNQINAFIMYNFRDNNDQFYTGFYNHGWLIPSSIRYNENVQNWNGWYYPGIAYFNYLDHSDIDFHVVGTVGLEETEKTKFTVYPNPASDRIFIDSELNFSPQDIKIKDIRGRNVETIVNFTDNSINIATLSNGTYFVSIENDEVSGIEKFVIAR
ncbi:MAG: T9SS type A sorting domain-containing protein [bacterium]|nr:T9SS type A sorting domain-containing protein [bacterium]